MRRTIASLTVELGREPTDEEVQSELDIDQKKLQQLKRANMKPVFLDAPVSDDSDSASHGELISLPDEEDASMIASQRDMRKQIPELLKGLTPRERDVLVARFGLDGQPPQILDEVGQKFGVTRERIRQIEAKALRRLAKVCTEPDHILYRTIKARNQ